MADDESPTTTGALVRWAASVLHASPTPMIDARALAKSAFRLDDAGLITAEREAIDRMQAETFRAMVERRRQSEPVAYITGVREFWSLEFETAPGVLVPRTDSETLIEAVIKRRARSAPLRILDLGSGTGALLIALLTEFPNATGLGVDLNPDAVALAHRNARKMRVAERARFDVVDWFAGAVGHYDLIVANPPYIAIGDLDELPREVAGYESPLALFSGADGLDDWRKILAAAPGFLAQNGLLVGELGSVQKDKLKDIAVRCFPSVAVEMLNDLGGRPRAMVIDLAPPAK